MTQPVLLTVVGLSKRFGRRRVLTDISFACYEGQRVALVGPNGVGKSTLLRLVTGQIRPDAGIVEVAGRTLGRTRDDAREFLGYAPDGHQALPELTVAEFISLVRAIKGSGNALELAEAEEQRRRLRVDEFWFQPLSALSLGQKKRVLLLAALWRAPPLLVLDEPAIGLDPLGLEALEALLWERSERGLVTLFTSNNQAFTRRAATVTYHLTANGLKRGDSGHRFGSSSLGTRS